jgi:pyruvate dehydrogenase (quinone)
VVRFRRPTCHISVTTLAAAQFVGGICIWAVAKAAGLWGATVEHAGDLEASITAWLAHPGPALLNVKVNPQELVMPPFVSVEPAVGMSLYMTKAVLHGRTRDLVDLAEQNFV